MPVPVSPVAVRFPLSGQWCAANTPAHKVPSHGTDQLGQTYAYDFLQIDWRRKRGFKVSDRSFLQWITRGIELRDFYGWSADIHAPFDATVVEARDGCVERNPVSLPRDLFVVFKNALTFRAKNNAQLHPVLGNYLILKSGRLYALIAHARTGSLRVKAGDTVRAGEVIAQVGHSGNSSAPHLHFQLMDRQDLLTAKGVPCCFTHYQRYTESGWVAVENSIPGRRERIRA